MVDKANIDDQDLEEEEEEDGEAGPSPPRARPSRPPGRPQDGRSGGGGYRRPMGFRGRRKVCSFCMDKVKVIDWKNFSNLRRFVDDGGSIRARRKTGTCAKHQRRLAVAVKRARHLALLPYTSEHVRLASKN